MGRIVEELVHAVKGLQGTVAKQEVAMGKQLQTLSNQEQEKATIQIGTVSVDVL